MKNSDKERYTLDFSDNQTALTAKKSGFKKRTNSQGSWMYLGKAGEIGFGIAIPIVAGALIGSYFDQKFVSYPRATLGGILIGVVLSVITFIKTIQLLIENK
jgi:hypothetical protein